MLSAVSTEQRNNMITVIQAVAFFAFLSASVVLTLLYHNLLQLKKNYEEDRAQVKVNGALFDGEETFSKEEIKEVMQNFVQFEKLLQDKERAFKELRDYVVTIIERLEQRPEAVRRELLKETKHLRQLNKELQQDHKLLIQQVKERHGIIFEELRSFRTKTDNLNTASNFKRRY